MNILFEALLDINGKKNNTLNERCELMRTKIRKDLHPIPKGDNKYDFSPACYTLTASERYHFVDVLKPIKFQIVMHLIFLDVLFLRTTKSLG